MRNGTCCSPRRSAPRRPIDGQTVPLKRTPEGTGPTSADQRLFEVDVLRGFALSGVLLVNMLSFGADSIAWDSLPDRISLTAIRLLVDAKFWTLFSLLFGFGLALQMARLSVRSDHSLVVLLRRLAFLFTLGMLHALFYEGDILMLYAELGLVLLLLQRVPAKWLCATALALLLVFPLAHWQGPPRDDDPAPENVETAQMELQWEREDSVYVTGSIREILEYNAEVIPENPLADYLWPDSGLAVMAIIILGYLWGRAVLREKGIFPDRRYAAARWLGLSVGLAAAAALWPLMVFGGYQVYQASESSAAVQLAGDLLFVLSTVALASGYGAAVLLWAHGSRDALIARLLAHAGRMALTTYLGQALIFTTLFHGYGLGMAYRMGPFAVVVSALGIFAVQMALAGCWLKYFRHGPLEWLWRCFTYLSWQPLRR